MKAKDIKFKYHFNMNTERYFNQIRPLNFIEDTRYSFGVVGGSGECISECTNIQDVNKVLLFTDDIIALYDGDDNFLSYELIVKLPCGVWYLDTNEHNSLYDVLNYEDKYVKYVGTIYGSPELLEDK